VCAGLLIMFPERDRINHHAARKDGVSHPLR
jgi:hypothetical protein